LIYTTEAAIVRGFLKSILKNKWRSKTENPYVILYMQDTTTHLDWYFTAYDMGNDLLIGIVIPLNKRQKVRMEYVYLSCLDEHNMFYRTYSKKDRFKLTDLYPNVDMSAI